jgi:hypothetical protein
LSKSPNVCADNIRQSIRGLPAATPFFIINGAGLFCLWCIDVVKSNAGASYTDVIAVSDLG